MTEQVRSANEDMAICEAATKPPWIWEWKHPGRLGGNDIIIRKDNRIIAEIINPLRDEAVKEAILIAMAPEALPYWIDRAVEAHRYIKKLEDMLKETTVFIHDESHDYWECEKCGLSWCFNDGRGPFANQMYYCPKCGREIEYKGGDNNA